jgi:hypothetical protein
VQTVQGSAPIGTFVQLRVDGRIVEMKQVGFSGRYAFDDVPLPTGHATEIETLVFEPGNLQIPIEVHRERLVASEFLQDAGGRATSPKGSPARHRRPRAGQVATTCGARASRAA